MSTQVLTFFNNKGGVGKTSLTYHLAWMLAEMDLRIVACDLDPQANLTAAFLDEDQLIALWDDSSPAKPQTIFQCIEPLLKTGDIRGPRLVKIQPRLALLPGELALSGFEDALSEQWPASMGDANLYRPFRLLTAFWQVMQLAATDFQADLILVDVGPNLGAINRSALIASDYVVIPLAADLFSLQGLRNLGPTLQQWRRLWKRRLVNWESPDFPLPAGTMKPLGYVAQQHSVRLDRPVKAYDVWMNQIPGEYQLSILADKAGKAKSRPSDDPNCLAMLKHYRSLVPMAQEAHKPIFGLKVSDLAIGSHAISVQGAYKDFQHLAQAILERIDASAKTL